MSVVIAIRHGMLRARSVLAVHAPLLLNAGALTVGTLGSAVLGFAYWWFAARTFSPEAVGYASAAISLMNLLAHAGELGMGPFLMGELPRWRHASAAILIAPALLIATGLSAIIGVGYSLLSGTLVSKLGGIVDGLGPSVLFIAGCGLTGLTIVIDQAFVGLLRSEWQMSRNMAFSALKLLLLVAVAKTTEAGPIAIFATWVAGQAASLVILSVWVLARRHGGFSWRPTLSPLKPHVRSVLGHHALSITIQAPVLVLPFVVAVTLSPETNAAFYAAWTLINVALLVPSSLSSVILSVGTQDPGLLASRLRIALAMSAAVGLGAGLVFLFASPLILSLFNPRYPEIAGPSLQLLGFGAIGLLVKFYYVAVQRLRGRLAAAAGSLVVSGAVEIAAAIIGGLWGGLFGLTAGWVCAVLIEATCMLPVILRVARGGLHEPAEVARPSPVGITLAGGEEVIWLQPRPIGRQRRGKGMPSFWQGQPLPREIQFHG